MLVGHSIGEVKVLRALERHDMQAAGRFAGALLVSTAAHEVGYGSGGSSSPTASTGSASAAPQGSFGCWPPPTTRSTSPTRWSTSGNSFGG